MCNKICFRCGSTVTTKPEQVSAGYDAACLNCDEDLIGSEIKTEIIYFPWGKKFKCRYMFDSKVITKIHDIEKMRELKKNPKYKLVRV